MDRTFLDQFLPYLKDAEQHLENSFAFSRGDEAADVVQDIAARFACKAAFVVNHPRKFFLECCRNQAKDYFKRNTRYLNRHRPHEESSDPSRQRTPVDLLASPGEVRRLLRILDPEARKVAVLRMRGHRNPDIARRLNVSQSTVRMRVMVAKKQLRSA